MYMLLIIENPILEDTNNTTPTIINEI